MNKGELIIMNWELIKQSWHNFFGGAANAGTILFILCAGFSLLSIIAAVIYVKKEVNKK